MFNPNQNLNFPKDLNIQPLTFPSIEDSNTLSSLYGHESQKQAIEQYGIAGRVWEAAYILIVYLNPPENLIFDPPPFSKERRSESIQIIELGSGSGIIGINIAHSLKSCLGDFLILTDLPEVCPLLESNLGDGIKDHSLRNLIHVRPLTWGNSDQASFIASDLCSQHSCKSVPLTHILCSDLIYFPELLAPLLRTIIELSSSHPIASSQPQILISYKIRSLPKEAPFWAAFGLWFTFEPVLVRERFANGSVSTWQRFGSAFDGPMFIFVAQRRPESLNWNVPSDDRDLLAGFGAYGTMDSKVDDSFENILLMLLCDTELSDPEFI